MTRKNALILTLTTLVVFGQCSSDKSVRPKVDIDQASRQLMKELVPQLTGTWRMKQLQIKYQNSTFQRELKIKHDTTLTSFATLTLARALVQQSPTGDRYEGTIQYGTRTYPIQFDLLAGPWIFNQKGPKAYFMLDYNFPVGHSERTEEAYLLQQIGLLRETFTLDISPNGMTWQGLNRGISQIDLVKK